MPFDLISLFANCVQRLPNMALNLAPFGRWALRQTPAQRRLALR